MLDSPIDWLINLYTPVQIATNHRKAFLLKKGSKAFKIFYFIEGTLRK